MFRSYGGRPAFAGQIVTLKLFEDNSLVREALGEDGRGKVLVVDGGGSQRCATVGDQLAVLARKNGWEGIVVYGCIRDSAAIGEVDLGVRALATHPRRASRRASVTAIWPSPSAASTSGPVSGFTPTPTAWSSRIAL